MTLLLMHFLTYMAYALEINTGMGFAKTSEKERLLVVNGVYPVEFNLQFKNQLINFEEASKITKLGDWDCTDFDPAKLIKKLNAKLSEKFLNMFEPLELDLQAKQRSQRGVVATALVGAGITLADKLIGKAVDYLFDSQNRKTEHTVRELKASLYTIKHELKLSSIELCSFGRQVLTEKINRIGFELSLSMENQIKNEIQDLYFGNLDNKFKLSACKALNEHASQFDCLKIVKSRDFVFHVLSINVEKDIAIIQIQILTPILSKTIVGHRVFNFGVPRIIDNCHAIVKGSIPDFITFEKEFKFKSKPINNIIDEHLLSSNPKIDIDCFKNNTEGDQKCDALVEFTSANFIIEHVRGHTILINFISCSFTALNTIDEPLFFEMGTHKVKFDLGFLTCGEDRISFGHSSFNFRKHISYESYSVEFNLKESNEIENTINQNIFDPDHLLEDVSIFPKVSLRLILIGIFSIIMICSLIGCFCFYKQIKIFSRRHAPPALVY